MKFTYEQFQQDQLGGMPAPVEGVSLTGQTILITGANIGLGFEAAKHFANRGPGKLVIVCRNEKKGEDALERIRSETGFQNVELWIADFGSFESVKALKSKIDALDRLDILVENAGIAAYDYAETKDGWESSLQVNVLGPAYHIVLSLPKLLKTAKNHPETVPRVVVVTSGLHHWANITPEVVEAAKPLEFMNVKDRYNPDNRYNESKALEVMFVRALQFHLPSVTCCTVSPGFCHSELNRGAVGERDEAIKNRAKQLAHTTEEGSRQLLYAAIGQRDREKEMRAGYVTYSKVSECSDFILSEEGQRLEKKMWTEIRGLLAEVDGEAKDVVEKYLS
ncbi:hypothetical protein V5O48_014591 [Marasmius crinis-equi]|uniref:NAD(P)-binding protein n=1 Tax=Marasmius crinis-equi TaxID=585013 RepID=A0ABR3EWY1_9AGAR